MIFSIRYCVGIPHLYIKYVCLHLCVLLYICVYMCISHAYMDEYINIYIYVYINTHIYIYIDIFMYTFHFASRLGVARSGFCLSMLVLRDVALAYRCCIIDVESALICENSANQKGRLYPRTVVERSVLSQGCWLR